MSFLEEATYGYSQGEAIQCRVKSANLYGYGDFTQIVLTTGLRVVPHQMLAPVKNVLTDQT